MWALHKCQMVMNLMAIGVGLFVDASASIPPIIAMAKFAVETVVNLVMMVLPTILMSLGYMHRAVYILIMRPRLPAPAPVWTLIKMPMPCVNLMGKVCQGHLLNLLTDVVQQISPVITAYMMEFAKRSMQWMKEFGEDELDKQFSEVFDPENARQKVDLGKFIKDFHRGACTHTIRMLQPKLKGIAQSLLSQAEVVAAAAAESTRAVSSPPLSLPVRCWQLFVGKFLPCVRFNDLIGAMNRVRAGKLG
jgi:hypothetical protein